MSRTVGTIRGQKHHQRWTACPLDTGFSFCSCVCTALRRDRVRAPLWGRKENRSRERERGRESAERLGNLARLGPEAVDLPSLFLHVVQYYWMETAVR